ncbi:MAG TPA: hypothetical protein VFM53_14975, partial [Anaeromyxobacteraceae bacterium]|nr:hypothetical protein [Anaeromyxobacteraceae bacterium]
MSSVDPKLTRRVVALALAFFSFPAWAQSPAATPAPEPAATPPATATAAAAPSAPVERMGREL